MKSTSLTTNERPESSEHPCPKPTNAWSWLLNRASLPCEIILDPFLGSGTTAYCAKKLGRKCIGIEIEEKYCEIAAKRCSQMVLALETPQRDGAPEPLFYQMPLDKQNEATMPCTTTTPPNQQGAVLSDG
jgi:hypothetical protein